MTRRKHCILTRICKLCILTRICKDYILTRICKHYILTRICKHCILTRICKHCILDHEILPNSIDIFKFLCWYRGRTCNIFRYKTVTRPWREGEGSRLWFFTIIVSLGENTNKAAEQEKEGKTENQGGDLTTILKLWNRVFQNRPSFFSKLKSIPGLKTEEGLWIKVGIAKGWVTDS